MKHWAYEYIGKPWRPGEEGPSAYYCWGLVKHIYAVRLGLHFPSGVVGSDIESPGVSQIMRSVNLRRVEGASLENDVVMLRNTSGKRHVGMFIRANRMLGVLHSNGTMRDGQPVGCVMFQSMAEVLANGFSEPELWRIKPWN